MFSDQEIRAAMGDLVKQKGEDHTSYGRYADPTTGRGACFLGALCEHMGLAVPAEGTPASGVMGKVSERMKDAFALAQYLNDQHYEWKYVLMGVDEVLNNGVEKLKLGCPCGCAVNANYTAIVNKVKAKRAFDMAQKPKCPVSTYSNGGMIAANLGQITFNVNMATANLSAFAAAFFEEGVAFKKDHALVA